MTGRVVYRPEAGHVCQPPREPSFGLVVEPLGTVWECTTCRRQWIAEGLHPRRWRRKWLRVKAHHP